MNTTQKHKLQDGFSRRQILKYGLYGSLSAALPGSLWLGGCGKKEPVKPSNVILISLDTLRADHLGCYGYQRPTTPTLDKFASEGVLFEDVTSTSPWTLPAHGSMLTGLYPNRHGLKSLHCSLPDDITTLAEVFKQHGFSTAAVVNVYFVSEKYGFDRGFDSFVYIERFVDEWRPSKVGDKAIEWLSQQNDKPFFLFLHYFDVHGDYSSSLNYEKQFVRPYQGIADGTTEQLHRFRDGLVSLNQTDAEHLIDLYDAGIRQLDDGIARLFSCLETKKLLDNSLIIITSDHGEEFLDHGGVLHSQTQYQELVHIPLIMRGPGIPRSKRIKQAVSMVDVMPTVLSSFAISEPTSLDGLDLCPLWQKKGYQLPARYIFSEASKEKEHPQKFNPKFDIKRAVRHPRYKLHYDKLTKGKKLYDLQNDLQEKFDVASKHPQLVDSMLLQLKDFMSVSKKGIQLPPLSPEEIQKLKSLGYID